jgi:hypothetical protein
MQLEVKGQLDLLITVKCIKDKAVHSLGALCELQGRQEV